MQATAPTVQARDLQKSFDDFVAVAGIDFETGAGECFGFLGPNGAGKTTTMKMIGCQCPAGGGTLSVLGLDVNRDARRIKRQLGVVPQEDNQDFDRAMRGDIVVTEAKEKLGKADSFKIF